MPSVLFAPNIQPCQDNKPLSVNLSTATIPSMPTNDAIEAKYPTLKLVPYWLNKGLNLPVNVLVGLEAFLATKADDRLGNSTYWGGLGVRIDYSLWYKAKISLNNF